MWSHTHAPTYQVSNCPWNAATFFNSVYVWPSATQINIRFTEINATQGPALVCICLYHCFVHNQRGLGFIRIFEPSCFHQMYLWPYNSIFFLTSTAAQFKHVLNNLSLWLNVETLLVLHSEAILSFHLLSHSRFRHQLEGFYVLPFIRSVLCSTVNDATCFSWFTCLQ